VVKVPEWNYAKEARKGRTPISTQYSRFKTTVTGKHAADRRARVGEIVSDYESGRKLPRQYASPNMIAKHGPGARVPISEAIDGEARPLMLPSYTQRVQPRNRASWRGVDEPHKGGVTRMETPAQAAAARRNLAKARGKRKGR
jgi:hypothetical protein